MPVFAALLSRAQSASWTRVRRPAEPRAAPKPVGRRGRRRPPSWRKPSSLSAPPTTGTSGPRPLRPRPGRPRRRRSPCLESPVAYLLLLMIIGRPCASTSPCPRGSSLRRPERLRASPPATFGHRRAARLHRRVSQSRTVSYSLVNSPHQQRSRMLRQSVVRVSIAALPRTEKTARAAPSGGFRSTITSQSDRGGSEVRRPAAVTASRRRSAGVRQTYPPPAPVERTAQGRPDEQEPSSLEQAMTGALVCCDMQRYPPELSRQSPAAPSMSTGTIGGSSTTRRRPLSTDRSCGKRAAQTGSPTLLESEEALRVARVSATDAPQRLPKRASRRRRPFALLAGRALRVALK